MIGSLDEAACFMCGARPAAPVDALGRATCAACVKKYVVAQCALCGVWITRHKDHARGPCTDCAARAMWRDLPDAIREMVDEAVVRDHRIAAVKALAKDAPPEFRRSVHEAQDIISLRYDELKDHVEFKPERGPDLPDLIVAVDAFDDPPVAFEAIWDGDTQGWFVVLLAIVEQPGAEHNRYTATNMSFYRRRAGDMRLFNGQAPPWPESAEATADGVALAAHFGVPFHFASPDEPDDRASRWWDQPY
jgi:hypothetical protein